MSPMPESKWFERSYRRNLVDMHIDDWDESFLSRLDPRTYVEMLKTANVKSAMVYTNSHIGYCYWPTKSGQMHRGIGGRDMFGEIVGLCHENGIDVIAYYTLVFNNWAYDHDPSWRILYEGGTPSRDIPPLGRYGVVCPNNMGYRAFVEAQVKEICTGYKLEGIFFDMTFWPGVCFCAACRERYAKEVGGEMPTIINWQDSQWVAFQKKREEWLIDFAAFATGTAKRLSPGISVEHNSAPLVQPWFIGTTIGLRDQNDYIGGDLYGGFGEQSFVCKLYHSITPNQPFEFMTSRCYPSLRDHTTMKSKEMLELHAYLAMAHNGAFFFIDAIDPVGAQNPKVYERMGEIFGTSRDYEPYLGGEMCQDIAIYFSLDSKMDFSDNGKPANLGSRNIPHLDAALGAARTLRENHVPFGVISRNNLKDKSAYKVIILPDVLVLSEEEAAALTKFVEDGGGLYASGQTDLTHLQKVFGISTEGETAETVTYITPTSRGRNLLVGVDPAYPLSIAAAPASALADMSSATATFGRQVKTKAANPVEVMATLTLPYTDPQDTRKIASIHSNPPGVATDYASVVCRPFGKGKVIWVAAPLEAAVQQPHKQVFIQMIRSLASAPFSFEAEAPPVVEVTLFHQPDKKRYVVNLVNEQEVLPPVPVFNATVRIRLDGKRAVRAALLPVESPLSFAVRGDYVEVVVPELDIFQMLLLEYA
jgi:Hypothetical glycosyl hydrolase 6/Beta-galactosidase trimerisation domain